MQEKGIYKKIITSTTEELFSNEVNTFNYRFSKSQFRTLMVYLNTLPNTLPKDICPFLQCSYIHVCIYAFSSENVLCYI